MKAEDLYNNSFYENRDKATAYAAKTILRVVMHSCPELGIIRSAVDIGCGVGTWLNQLHAICGTDDIWGYDGDYVNKDLLVIPRDHFIPYDLRKGIPHDRRYDIAISMEVAEHLPPSRADSFVEDLCALSDSVLFSAATLYQGGSGHVNEQRLNYWVDRFSKRGYGPLDIVRTEIWNDDRIPAWYKQNTLLFRKSDKDKSEYASVRDLIHPDIFEEKMRNMERYNRKPYFRFYFKMQRIGRKIKRLFK